MFERFTSIGRTAIAQAAVEARQLHRPFVGPEHIFLGVVCYEQGVAGWVLAQMGVTLDAAREKVETLAGRGDQPVEGEIPFSPEGKKVLALAVDEAKRLGHNYIGTEHLLLALFRLDYTPGAEPIARVIQQFHLERDRVQYLVLQELAQPQRRGAGKLQPLPQLAQLEGTRSNVVMCRVGNPDLEAIDTLVEAGIRATRSDAAAWLIHAGIEGNKSLFERLQATVGEIRRLREQAQAITREVSSGEPQPKEPGPPPTPSGDAPSGGEASAGVL